MRATNLANAGTPGFRSERMLSRPGGVIQQQQIGGRDLCRQTIALGQQLLAQRAQQHGVKAQQIDAYAHGSYLYHLKAAYTNG